LVEQAAFPDCEAMRRVEPGLWQRSRIEFEKESRNFLAHMHPASHCDLIVCWVHNWKECPVEVLELSKLVKFSNGEGPTNRSPADLRGLSADENGGFHRGDAENSKTSPLIFTDDTDQERSE
jgi:hypothetical protein